ncbi:hypothetical protein EDB81DRAFT_808298 [Dactylonectria macrodidyma]|uniref:Uncharacterized protein n=1 Tax=Dactylonectria macrodidyma TaxID=307937 RepID=A0A9P9E662_9HYPO|nr:hypothetical protein EDB81DRAFT_808298 [Dactylonectria macrodidyma]
MLSPTVAAILCLISAATAAPAATPSSTVLAADDVIVLNVDGTSQVMKATEFDRLETRALAAPVSINPANTAKLTRRGCEESTEVQITSDEEFLNWDVAISPVLSSSGGTGTVAVTSGYSISNTVSVSASYDVTIIKDLLSSSLSISYSETWSTTESQTLSFTVPENQNGVIVSQPYVRRVQGNILSGCTDSPDKEAFTSDTYTSQSYGNLNWVKGVIRLCSSEQYPIPYCIGTGEHS